MEFIVCERSPAQIALNAVVAMLLLVISLIDWKTMEIPDRFPIALLGCGITAVFLFPEVDIGARVAGLVCVSVPMLLICLMMGDAFGGGDIKLTAVMGFYLGWKACLVGTVIGFFIGGVQAAVLLVSGRVKYGEGAHMAFGPALCAGFFVAELYGLQIFEWYLYLFALS